MEGEGGTADGNLGKAGEERGMRVGAIAQLGLRGYWPFSHRQQGRIDFNTINPSLSTGKDFLIHSL